MELFESYSKEELDNLLTEANSKITNDQTKNVLLILQNYMNKKEIITKIENMKNDELNDLLYSFFAEVRTHPGNMVK